MRRTLKIELYYTAVEVRVVQDINKCAERLDGINGVENTGKAKVQPRALTVSYGPDKHYVLFCPTTLTHGVINHEIEHVRGSIEKHTGNEIDSGYLVELISDFVHGFLRDKCVKVKYA